MTIFFNLFSFLFLLIVVQPPSSLLVLFELLDIIIKLSNGTSSLLFFVVCVLCVCALCRGPFQNKIVLLEYILNPYMTT